MFFGRFLITLNCVLYAAIALWSSVRASVRLVTRLWGLKQVVASRHHRDAGARCRIVSWGSAFYSAEGSLTNGRRNGR